MGDEILSVILTALVEISEQQNKPENQFLKNPDDSWVQWLMLVIPGD
jgi:hypothetical protein